MLSLKQFGQVFDRIVERVEADERAKHRALEKGAKIIERRAKEVIGHYQHNTGPFHEWVDLKQSTVDEKERLGFAPPDNPLLRTGKMRASIEHTVKGDEAHIGSNDDVAVFQELGTHTIPPRSFLGVAAFQTAPEVARVVGVDLFESYFPRIRGNYEFPSTPRFSGSSERAISAGLGSDAESAIVGELTGAAEDDSMEILGEIALGLGLGF